VSEIGVVHSAELLGDGKQGLGPQANNVVFCVVVGQRHLGSAYYQAVAEDHQRRHGAKVPHRPLLGAVCNGCIKSRDGAAIRRTGGRRRRGPLGMSSSVKPN
jgi:hypothetical protein